MNSLSYRNARMGAFVRYANMLLLAIFALGAPMPFNRAVVIIVCIGIVIANTATFLYMLVTKRVVIAQYIMLACDLPAVYTGIYFTGMLTSPFLTMLPLFFFNVWFVDYNRRATIHYGLTALAIFIGLSVFWVATGGPGAGWIPGRYPLATLYFLIM